MLTKSEAVRIIRAAGYAPVKGATDEVFENGYRSVGLGEDGLTVYQVTTPTTSRYLKAGGKTLVYAKTNPDELRLFLDSKTLLLMPIGTPAEDMP